MFPTAIPRYIDVMMKSKQYNLINIKHYNVDAGKTVKLTRNKNIAYLAFVKYLCKNNIMTFRNDFINCEFNIPSVSHCMDRWEPGTNIPACPEIQGVLSKPFEREIQYKELEEKVKGQKAKTEGLLSLRHSNPQPCTSSLSIK